MTCFVSSGRLLLTYKQADPGACNMEKVFTLCCVCILKCMCTDTLPFRCYFSKLSLSLFSDLLCKLGQTYPWSTWWQLHQGGWRFPFLYFKMLAMPKSWVWIPGNAYTGIKIYRLLWIKASTKWINVHFKLSLINSLVFYHSQLTVFFFNIQTNIRSPPPSLF